MGTLLKDMPIHMERIENNRLLGEEIIDILNEYADYSETRKSNAVLEGDFNKVGGSILDKVSEFVNQNYAWKGIKA